MTRPTAVELLSTARRTLFRELLPALPESLNYEARMIANAMAIAIREMEQCPESKTKPSATRLLHLLPESSPESTPENRMICQLLRQGAFDKTSPKQRELLDVLYQDTQRKLAISNPKLLRE